MRYPLPLPHRHNEDVLSKYSIQRRSKNSKAAVEIFTAFGEQLEERGGQRGSSRPRSVVRPQSSLSTSGPGPRSTTLAARAPFKNVLMFELAPNIARCDMVKDDAR